MLPAGLADKERIGRWLFVSLVLLAAALPVSMGGMSIFLGLAIFIAALDLLAPPRIGWKRTPFDEPLFILFGLAVLSSILSVDPARSLPRLGSYWAFFLLYFYVWYAPDVKRIKVCLNVLLAVGGAVCVLAIVQHFTGFSLGKTPHTLPAEMAVDGVRYLAVGTFSHHQTFANVYVMIFCLAFSFLLVPASLGRRLLLGGLTLALALAVIFSYTRGVWLAMGLAAMVITALRSRRMLAGMAVSLGLAGSLLMVIPSSYARRALSIFHWERNLDRLMMWQASWEMLRDHPLTGVGLGNYADLQYLYLPPKPEVEVIKAHAHNAYLQMAVELGPFSLVALAWFWYIILRIGFSSLGALTGREGFRSAAIRGAVAAVIAFLFDGFFQNNFGDAEVLLLLLFMAAVIVVLRVRHAERASLMATEGTIDA